MSVSRFGLQRLETVRRSADLGVYTDRCVVHQNPVSENDEF